MERCVRDRPLGTAGVVRGEEVIRFLELALKEPPKLPVLQVYHTFKSRHH